MYLSNINRPAHVFIVVDVPNGYFYFDRHRVDNVYHNFPFKVSQNNKTSVVCANGIQLLLFNNECVNTHFS